MEVRYPARAATCAMLVPIVPAPITATFCTSRTLAIAPAGLPRDDGQLATRLPAFLHAEQEVLVAGDDQGIGPGAEGGQRALHYPLGTVLGRAILRRVAADLRVEGEEHGAVAQ